MRERERENKNEDRDSEIGTTQNAEKQRQRLRDAGKYISRMTPRAMLLIIRVLQCKTMVSHLLQFANLDLLACSLDTLASFVDSLLLRFMHKMFFLHWFEG